MERNNNTKVIVIGIDGGTWDLLTPLIKKGELPNLKRLIEKGTCGKLKSTIPPVTIPAWLSFATGKNPGKLGCFDFLIPDGSLNSLKSINSRLIVSKTFYEILSENGKKCTIINLPGSYPPKIKETIITDFLNPSNDFIFPPDLVSEIPELKNYRLVPNRSLYLKGKINDYISDIIDIEKVRFECAMKLFKKEWDFFFLLFSGTDWIQHILYDKLVSGELDDNLGALELYNNIDKYIGWFVDNAPRDATIMIMSDHGFRTCKKTFFVNEWLKKEGFLRIESRTISRKPRHRSEQETFNVLSKKINIKLPITLLNHLKSLSWMYPIYISLTRILPLEIQKNNIQSKLSSTIAYTINNSCSNFGGIYINDKERFVDGSVDLINYDSLRNEIINKLGDVENPKTGKKIIKHIWKKEEIYFGPQLSTLPDIIIMLSDEYRVGTLVFGEIFGEKRIEPCDHSLQGIFACIGPKIRNNQNNKRFEIIDICPTILHLFNIAIPKDIDGKVLKELFKEESDYFQELIAYKDTDESEKIKNKIRAMKRIKN